MSIAEYSYHTKKRIAVIATVCIGIALLAVLIFMYAHLHSSTSPKKTEAASKIGDFYATIKQSAQSSFDSK